MQDIRCEPARFLSVQTVQSDQQITKVLHLRGNSRIQQEHDWEQQEHSYWTWISTRTSHQKTQPKWMLLTSDSVLSGQLPSSTLPEKMWICSHASTLSLPITLVSNS